MENRRVVADTTIFVAYLRATKKEKTKLIKLTKEAEILVTAVTIYELLMGARTEEKQQHVFDLVEGLTILPFDK
ncbi:MAG: PIN domain-containing protein [Bacteroidota bacterium]